MTPSPTQRLIPNALTVARLVMACVFFVVLAMAGPYDARPRTAALAAGGEAPVDTLYLAACIIFILAAITDAFDGTLARRWNAISAFGRVMDPFADKVLVLGGFIMLAGPDFASRGGAQISGVLPWMAVIVLARELLVTSLRGVLESRGIDFSATFSGKAKMVLQSICIPLVLLILAVGDPAQGPGRQIVIWGVGLTIAVSAWSGVPYVVRAIKAFKPASGS